MDPFEYHKKNRGKVAIRSKVEIKTREDLSLAYTPGVAEVSMAIHKDKSKVWDYTSRWNTIAVVSDGSAVLGLGNIGAEAALPVMEGKAILFKELGDVDAFPLCLRTQEVDDIVKIIEEISPTFGGINLEDVSAPRCFEIVERVEQSDIEIPIFHDDQDGAAIATSAALENACKVLDKEMKDLKIVVLGAGAAGIATAKLLSKDAKDIFLVDTKGIINKSRDDLNLYKQEMLQIINKENRSGSLTDAMKKTDVFIGVSAPNIVTKDMIRSMNKDPIIFAMANPVPEIMPDEAKAAGAAIVGTGRSDFPNQINNSLVFPGLFRGTLDARARRITKEMKLAAVHALANYMRPEAEKILPDPLDREIPKIIAEAVKKAARK